MRKPEARSQKSEVRFQISASLGLTYSAHSAVKKSAPRKQPLYPLKLAPPLSLLAPVKFPGRMDEMNLLKSIGAVVAGFVVVGISHSLTDFVLEKTGVFPPPFTPAALETKYLAVAASPVRTRAPAWIRSPWTSTPRP